MDTHIREFAHNPDKKKSSILSPIDLSIQHSIGHIDQGKWNRDSGLNGILIINKNSEILYANAYVRHLLSQMRMTINSHGIITDQSGLGYGDLGYATFSKSHFSVGFDSVGGTDFLEEYIEKYIEKGLEIGSKKTFKNVSIHNKEEDRGICDDHEHNGAAHHPFQAIWQLCEIIFQQKSLPHYLSKKQSLPLVVEDDVDFPTIGTLRLQCRSFHLDSGSGFPLPLDGDGPLPLDDNELNSCVLVTLQQVSIVTAKEAIAQFHQHRLTEREHQIWRLHQRGWGHRDIAAKLRLPLTAIQQRLQTILIKQQTWNLPQPGEIWQVDRNIDHPRNLPYSLPQALFSTPAQDFLSDGRLSRYVIVVGDPQALTTASTSQLWVAVMVLSSQLDAMSESDVLLPAYLSDLNNDVVAETWHIVPMLVSQFLCPVSKPLPQSIYDQLVQRGDRHGNKTDIHDRLDSRRTDAQVLEDAGDPNPSFLEQFLCGTADPDQFTISNTSNLANIATQLQSGCYSLDHPRVQAFHQQERQWSEVLRIPVTTCQLYVDTLHNAESIVDDAVWLEQLRRGDHNEFNLP